MHCSVLIPRKANKKSHIFYIYTRDSRARAQTYTNIHTNTNTYIYMCRAEKKKQRKARLPQTRQTHMLVTGRSCRGSSKYIAAARCCSGKFVSTLSQRPHYLLGCVSRFGANWLLAAFSRLRRWKPASRRCLFALGGWQWF